MAQTVEPGRAHVIMNMTIYVVLRCEPPPAHGYGDAAEATDPVSLKARIMLRRLWLGISALLSSVAPVFGEVSLVRSGSG